MIKRSGFILLASSLALSMLLVVNFATRMNAVSQELSLQTPPASGEGIAKPAQVSPNYWLIKSLSMRTLACLCANRYPVGLGAGKNAEFTYRVETNGETEVAIHSLCIQKNKEWNRRIVGRITLPLRAEAEVVIGTPEDDRYNPNAAVLREKLKGAVVVPFKRKAYRLNRCPTNGEHYKGLNWAQPERWPGM